MFDPVTASLVRRAPALPGLDPANLVDQLTSAYVDIATARLALGGASDTGAIDLNEIVRRMSRLADTYEGQIVLSLNPDLRHSTAYVAGSARQVIAQIGNLTEVPDRTTRLDADVVGAEIAAALLFLIAERSSDASEAAKDIRAAGEKIAIRRALILALGRFCRGRLVEAADVNLASERISEQDDVEHAADLLFREVLRGLIMLAQVGLGRLDATYIDIAQLIFQNVMDLSIDVGEPLDGRTFAPSIFAGPHHLAALLMQASEMLKSGTVVNIPAPSGADGSQWTQWLKTEATERPFLWSNHREAIDTGYLDQGASLVMTTPTGSGKSTLSALKISATIASGKTVLYLAPTHALVGQIERDLNGHVAGLVKAESIDEVTLDEIVQELPDLAVVTPERCFALLTFEPKLFRNVGLLVFDECHLLGVSRPATDTAPARVDRRGIDAMLCLLTFMTVNKTADYLLLSAMISNGGEIADWLNTVLQRPVISFDDKWKPTRQLRACVTYDASALARLESVIPSEPPPSEVVAVPYGLFSLASGWNPAARDKLVVRAFANAPLPLKVGKRGSNFWLTANRYEVAAKLADGFAQAGLKVIVFCESVPRCVSVAKTLNKGRARLAATLSAEQSESRDSIIAELGSQDAIYDAGFARAAVHHGELLPQERILVEELFRARDSGVSILAATSTLAQGLNLPCEVVILASMDRMDDSDPDESRRVPLLAHEVLNALGRAGRAGQTATGLSIVIPPYPIGCDVNTRRVNHAEELAIIFAEGDQCLPLMDPITTLYDQIEIGGVSREEEQYLLRRLSISLGTEREGVETFESLTRRSFGFHQRSKLNTNGAAIWLQTRKYELTAILASVTPPPSLPWQEELAAKSGASSAFIASLAESFSAAPISSGDALAWMSWLLSTLDVTSTDFDAFLRPETLGRVFGRAHEKQPDVLTQRLVGLAGVQMLLPLWFSGRPLRDIEGELAKFIALNEGIVKRPTVADPKAKRARRFSLRLAPDLGFLCGVMNQVAIKIAEENGAPPPAMIGFLPQLVRRGFATPYHFAIYKDNTIFSRPQVHQGFERLSPHIVPEADDDWAVIRDKVENATAILMFTASED